MAGPYSMDLRKRVVAAVKEEGLSRHQAAARFGVAISTAINWVKRFEDRGSFAPDKMGGLKVDYRSVWEFVHAEGLSFKKRRWSPVSGTAPMLPAGASNGSNIGD